MKLDVHDKLNSTCEILGLLYVSQNYDELIKSIIQSLNESGINGEAFYKSNLKILDKYVKEFRKHMVCEDENELFTYNEKDDIKLFFIIIASLLAEDEMCINVDDMSEYEVKKLILNACKEISDEDESGNDGDYESLEEILKFIDKQDISDKNKWKILKMINNPKKYMKWIIKLIDNNKYAYNEAYKSVEKQLIKLINKTKKYTLSGEFEVIKNLSKGEGELTVIPTLAFAVSIFTLKKGVFTGVIIESIHKEQIKEMGTKADLILKLKALGDNSKLEAIGLLKKGPRYSLEIAESLKLTPATVSYHMSTLLEIGLVFVEKKQGKIYYNLNKLSIEKFIDNLKSELL